LLGSEPAGCYTDTCGQDFVYLRFIGDRSIDEKDFGRLQKDRIKELRLWSRSVQGVKNKAKYAIVAANNRYAGFGPATANSFRRMAGLKEEAVWEAMKQSRLECLPFFSYI
jgi:uncharacterized protein YecE (DUF72 family)